MEMKRRRARPAIRAVVFSREGIHGILAEKTFLGRELHGFLRRFFKTDLIKADRTIHIKQNAAGVLANGLRLVFRDGDVLVNDFHRVGREGVFLLVLQRREDGLMHVVRNLGGRAADKFDQGILQLAHKFNEQPKAWTRQRQSVGRVALRLVGQPQRGWPHLADTLSASCIACHDWFKVET